MNSLLVELLAGHAAVYVMWLLPGLMKCFGPHLKQVFDKFCQIVAVMTYLRTMFVACARYPRYNVII